MAENYWSRGEYPIYQASNTRYDDMQYLRCGRSGIKLPRVSLGMWHNFGSEDRFENMKELIHTAFDCGITHFDLANNYGPVYGSAEENFGRIMESDLRPYRDEMIISSKAGYDMWSGPYGDWGSRKYLMASLDQSLKRMKLDYVDIFYHHRPDPETPLEETMNALSDMVRQGKALYVGLSNYNSEQLKKACEILNENKTPLLITQPKYNMFDRFVETDGLLDTAKEVGCGVICFSPLAQGLLSTKYLNGIPSDSRAAKDAFLKKDSITEDKIAIIRELNEIAGSRNQSLPQMALSWVLRENKVTSVLIGASKKEQILDNIRILDHLEFSQTELDQIDTILERDVQ
ncbi:MAG: L-glyceraldehyde 3-phosphate reductase [Lachnospiraceae bacterium]|nr:L-glyceraldehyde 3-phosphate reductase [Candidatus Merdinaster equi]